MFLVSRIIYIFFLICSFAFAQRLNDDVDEVSSPFKSFRYSEVIAIADSILLQDSLLSVSDLIEINRMKALSHFSLGEEVFARNSFYDILTIDPTFKLDPVQNSPKIINFFNRIKLDYLQAQIILKDQQAPIEQKIDQLTNTQTLSPQKSMKSAMVKSMLLPGWGHLHLERNKPGILLLTGTLATLPPMFYYIFDTNKKEKVYLNATEFEDINSRYDDYNKSYKIRNGFIAGFTIIWLYSQWDLFSGNSDQQKILIQPSLSKDNHGQLIWTANFTHRF